MLYLIGAVALLVLCFAAFVSRTNHLCWRLATELPFMTWMTLDDIVARGFSRFSTSWLLAALCNKKVFEYRLKPNLTLEELEEFKFVALLHGGNAHLFEYRRVIHVRRKPKKLKEKLSLFPGLGPAPA